MKEMTVLSFKYSPIEMCSIFVVTSLGINAVLTKALVASSTCSIMYVNFVYCNNKPFQDRDFLLFRHVISRPLKHSPILQLPGATLVVFLMRKVKYGLQFTTLKR